MNNSVTRDFFGEFGDILAKRYGLQPLPARQSTYPVDAAALDFGRYLRAARSNAGFLRGQLALKAGISEAEIAALEHGLILSTEIDPRSLHALARALGEDVKTFSVLLEYDIPEPGLAGTPQQARNAKLALTTYFGSTPKFWLFVLLAGCAVVASIVFAYLVSAGLGDNPISVTAVHDGPRGGVAEPVRQLGANFAQYARGVETNKVGLSLIIVLLLLLVWVAIWEKDLHPPKPKAYKQGSVPLSPFRRPAYVTLVTILLAMLSLSFGDLRVPTQFDVASATQRQEIMSSRDCSAHETIQAVNQNAAVDACQAENSKDIIALHSASAEILVRSVELSLYLARTEASDVVLWLPDDVATVHDNLPVRESRPSISGSIVYPTMVKGSISQSEPDAGVRTRVATNDDIYQMRILRIGLPRLHNKVSIGLFFDRSDGPLSFVSSSADPDQKAVEVGSSAQFRFSSGGDQGESSVISSARLWSSGGGSDSGRIVNIGKTLVSVQYQSDVVVYAYNIAGNRLYVTDHYWQTATHFTYDTLGNLAVQIAPAGRAFVVSVPVDTYTYGALDWTARVISTSTVLPSPKLTALSLPALPSPAISNTPSTATAPPIVTLATTPTPTSPPVAVTVPPIAAKHIACPGTKASGPAVTVAGLDEFQLDVFGESGMTSSVRGTALSFPVAIVRPERTSSAGNDSALSCLVVHASPASSATLMNVSRGTFGGSSLLGQDSKAWVHSSDMAWPIKAQLLDQIDRVAWLTNELLAVCQIALTLLLVIVMTLVALQEGRMILAFQTGARRLLARGVRR